MTRFNRPAVGTKTTNMEGAAAFSESPELELAGILLTSFANDSFYRSAHDTFGRVSTLVDGLRDKTFAAKAAIFARKEYGMRSITHVLAGEVGKKIKGEDWTGRFFERVVGRPDDILEILSYYLGKYSKPIPNSMKRGLGRALSKLDEYRLAKYSGNGKEIRMVDAVNLLHPKSTPALTALMKGTLKAPETWEVKLTQAGQTGETKEKKEELKGEAWKELIEQDNLGYFALLRNLRNIEQQAPEMLPKALNMLMDRDRIKKSKVLPFRFLTARKELEKTGLNRDVQTALSDALEISLDNCPSLPGKTLVALDISGSMAMIKDIAGVFAAVLYKKCDADLMLFSSDAQYVNLDPKDSVNSIAQRIALATGGTNFHSIFVKANKAYDRIIILSDMQGWMPFGICEGGEPGKSLAAYRTRTLADPKVYSWNLQDYGTLMFPERNVFCVSGFSEKVFDLFELLETDRNALIHRIEAVEL